MAKRNTFFEDEQIEKKIDIKQLGRTLKYILPYKKLLFLMWKTIIETYFAVAL